MGEGQASGTSSGIEQSPHKEVVAPVDWMGQQWEAHMETSGGSWFHLELIQNSNRQNRDVRNLLLAGQQPLTDQQLCLFISLSNRCKLI